MDFLGLRLELGLDFLLRFEALARVRLRAAVDLAERRRQVRQHEGVGVVRGKVLAALLGEIGLVALLFHREEQLFLLRVEVLLRLVEMEVQLGLVHQLDVRRLFEDAGEAGRTGLPELHAIEQQAGFPLQRLGSLRLRTVGGVELLQVLFCLAEVAVAKLVLRAHETFDAALVVRVNLAVAGDDGGAADDERGAGFINQDAVHLVHDGEVMPALDLVGGGGRHAVVAEVIEAELGVGAVGDVAGVLRATDGGGLVVEDAADREAEELIDRAHPLAVAGGEVVIDGDDVNAAPGEGVEKGRERGDEGLAFAGGHFRNHPLVQRHAADELHVEGHHLPAQRMPAHGDVRAAHAAAGVLHHGEGLGQDGLHGARQLGVVLDGGELGLPRGGFVAQDLLRLRLKGGLQLVDLLHERPQALQLAFVL